MSEQDKPGAVAVETAASLLNTIYSACLPRVLERDGISPAAIDAAAAIIQAAIDEATGAVEAERDRFEATAIEYVQQRLKAEQERDEARAALEQISIVTGSWQPRTLDASVKDHAVSALQKIKETARAALLAEPDLSPEASAKGEGGA